MPEELWIEEIIKKEVNREIGKLLEANLKQHVDFDGEGGLVCCDSWGRKESDTTK